MEMLKLVYLQWLSGERDKYVWEDRYIRPWDEIIGRMYLLKAHDEIENKQYAEALADFEQALSLLAKDGISNDYYVYALADKAIVQCFLGQYQMELATFRQALAFTTQPDDGLLQNYGAMLVLAGAFIEALNVLEAQLEKSPDDEYQRFTYATCLFHLERYQEAKVSYEQVLTENQWMSTVGLHVAFQCCQPDWNEL